MPINKRIELINLLESIILKENFNTFIKKSNKELTPEDNDFFIKNWYQYSSNFTRMWLNYLSDDKLLEILEKKLAKQNVDKKLIGVNSKV